MTVLATTRAFTAARRPCRDRIAQHGVAQRASNVAQVTLFACDAVSESAVSESADGVFDFTARACLRRSGIRAVEFIPVEAARGQPSSCHTGLPRAFRRHDTPGTHGSVVPRRARARRRGRPTLHASSGWERPGPAPARSPRRLREASPLRHLRNWTCCNLRCSRSFDYSIVSTFDSKISTGRHDEPRVPGDRLRRLR